MVTRCPKDDITSSFRASRPCKKLHVNYLMNSKNYHLVTDTFGICETAEDASSNNDPYEADIEFKDWVLEDNGLVITMVKN